MRTAYDIIIRPIITEQSMEDLDIKKYAFEVAKDANKIEIKKAVEEIFGVKVIKVTTENVTEAGRSRRFTVQEKSTVRPALGTYSNAPTSIVSLRMRPSPLRSVSETAAAA